MSHIIIGGNNPLKEVCTVCKKPLAKVVNGVATLKNVTIDTAKGIKAHNECLSLSTTF